MGCCISIGVAVEMQPEPEPEPEPEPDDECCRAQTVFKMVDADGSGCLDRAEVRKLGELLGTPLVESELNAAMRAMDADGSGSVDFDEFYGWWKLVNQREAEGKGVWAEESDDEVQPAELAAPASSAPKRGSARRADVSTPAPRSAPPERGRAKPATPASPAPQRGSGRRRGDASPPAAPSEHGAATPVGPDISSEDTAAEGTGSPETPMLIRRLVSWCMPQRKKTEREECRELFDQIDEDGSGLLDVSEIVSLAKLLGVSLNPAQAQEAMDEIDDDKSGEVDFEEFYGWFKRTSEKNSNHEDSKVGKASIRWAAHQKQRTVALASAQRSRSVLSHAIAGRTVEEMRTLHSKAREKEG